MCKNRLEAAKVRDQVDKGRCKDDNEEKASPGVQVWLGRTDEETIKPRKERSCNKALSLILQIAERARKGKRGKK